MIAVAICAQRSVIVRQAAALSFEKAISMGLKLGLYGGKKPVDANALQRYKLAYATVAAGVSAPWQVEIITSEIRTVRSINTTE